MAQRKLSDLYAHFAGRTEALLRHFLTMPPTAPVTLNGMTTDRLFGYSRGFLVNRLFHLWGEFCRGLVVASALGGYKRLNGVLVGRAPNISRPSDIPQVIKEKSVAGPGLRWEDPTWTARKVNQLQLNNGRQILLGIGAAPYDDLRRVRNFVVHPNPHTRSEFEVVAVTYSLFGVDSDDLLLHRLPGGGTVMEGWVRDLQSAALDAVR